MTSKLTREERVQSLYGLKIGQVLNPSDIESIKMLARMALAAMDSEPVAYTEKHEISNMHATGLYLRAWPADRARNAVEGYTIPLYRHAQPAPAFPDFDNVLESLDYEVRCNAWESEHVLKACQATYDACRAAMLQELQKSAGAEATCRSNKNVQVLHTKSPAQSDCCPAQNGDTPAQSQGWIPVSERMPKMGEHQCYVLAADFKNHYWPNTPNTQVGVYGDWFDDGNPTWDDGDGEDLHLKEVTHWMPLPAAPQGVIHG